MFQRSTHAAGSEAFVHMSRLFSLDPRSLALGRILFGLLLIVDLSIRATDLEAHYTDNGVLPIPAIHFEAWDFVWSLHAAHGALWFEAVLFAIAALLALALIAGYRTTFATVGSWLLLTSLHGRNPMLRDGQDDCFRVLLFFCAFLPLGALFSLDHRRDAAHAAARPSIRAQHYAGGVVSLASVALVLQICLMYWVSAVTKYQSPWWKDGQAVFYTLSMSRYQTALAPFLLGYPGLLRVLSFSVPAMELMVPVLLFVPYRNDLFRLAVIASFALLHLGFALCLHLGIFPFLNVAAWLMLLPAIAWEKVGLAIGDDARDRTFAAESHGRQEGRVPPDAPPSWTHTSVARAAVPALAIVLVSLLNLPVLDSRFALPKPIARIGVALGLQQFWAVFAPNPVTPLAMNDGWFVVAGTLESGEQVALHTDDERLSWEKPERVAATVKNHRWRHYFANLRVSWPPGSELQDTVERSREAYARFLCRRWNATHPIGRRLVKVGIHYMSQRLGVPNAPAKRVLFLDHTCAAP